MTIDTSREAIDRMTGMWGVGVEPNMARVTEALTALTRERDEALADIARIQSERAEFLAGVEALAGVLKGERDEALAREAALREALAGVSKGSEDYVAHTLGVSVEQARTVIAALTSTATAAAARDAALIERGRREGIEEMVAALQKAADLKEDGEQKDRLLGWIERFRAIATPPAEGGPR